MKIEINLNSVGEWLMDRVPLLIALSLLAGTAYCDYILLQLAKSNPDSFGVALWYFLHFLGLGGCSIAAFVYWAENRR